MDNKEKTNNIFIWAIIALLVVIAVMGFLLGKNSSNKTIKTDNVDIVSNTDSSAHTWSYDDLTLTVIWDKRCGDKCPTDAILKQLKTLPSIQWAKIEVKDFADEWVADYLNKNEIKELPLFVFSTNNFDVSKDPIQKDQNGQVVPKLNTYLQPIKDGSFNLSVWSTFNPFEKRSDKWFTVLDKQKLKAIKDSWYLKWNKDAKITWLEYSDLECPFCAKLHNANTDKDIFKKYWDKINMYFESFPLSFHKNAQTGAEILECLASQKWSDAYYSLIDTAYTQKDSDKDFLIKEAVKLWADETKLNKCLDDWTFTQKVKDTQNAGAELFGITGTPGNVLINNETGEYDIISWAYPTSEFEKVIDKLLK
jgi:predicted DsbA family dithiol-disulfide isomerase